MRGKKVGSRPWRVIAAVVVVSVFAVMSGCPDASLLDLITPVEDDTNGTNGETEEPETYTVTYHANGADSGTVPDAQTKTHGEALTLATNSGNLALTGHTFVGWNTETDGSGTEYAEGATYTSNTDLTLFANWTELPAYTVTYHANGADSGTVPSPQRKFHGVALTLASNTGNLALTGHTFVAWNTETDGSGAEYAEGAAYTADADVTLHADWAPAQNGQSADLNGAWRGEFTNAEFPEEVMMVNLMVTQVGADIVGGGGWAAIPTVPYEPESLLAVAEGVVSGDEFSLTLKPSDGYDDYTVSMSGTKDAVSIAGTWSDSDGGSGTFEMELHVYYVGDTGPLGGFVFYDKGVYSNGWRFIEAAPHDVETEWGNKPWGGYGTSVGALGTEIGAGLTNTQTIVNALGEGHYAAWLCDDLEDGIFNDWFLPSKAELNLMYQNLHLADLGRFEADWYWSSSEENATAAWIQFFNNGDQFFHIKHLEGGVRPARRF